MSGYSYFSYYYDILTRNIDYKKQYEYFCKLISKLGSHPGLLLDLACGTGSLSLEFAKNNVDVIAIDSSVDMLSIAKQKAIESDVDILFVCQEMQNFYLHDNVDTIICSLDSINHLDGIEDVKKTFLSCYKALKRDGILIFDVNTIYKNKEVLGDNTFIYDTDEVYCIWQNYFEDTTNTDDIFLDFFVREGDRYYKESEEFAECAYELCDLKNILDGINLKVLNIYNYMTFEPVTKTSEKAVFVCKKL